MSTGIDIKYVQESYKRMDDDELIRTATQDAYGLTPEAIEVVKAEIIKRGLDENIAKGVEAQNKSYNVEEIDTYCDIISKLACPSCGNTSEKLNATITGEAMSFILFTHYKKDIKIACPDCLDKAHNKALLTTTLLGWWGIPWGAIRTIQSLALNLRNKKTNHAQDHNDILRDFVLGHIGELETYRGNKEKLQQIIS